MMPCQPCAPSQPPTQPPQGTELKVKEDPWADPVELGFSGGMLLLAAFGEESSSWLCSLAVLCCECKQHPASPLALHHLTQASPPFFLCLFLHPSQEWEQFMSHDTPGEKKKVLQLYHAI